MSFHFNYYVCIYLTENYVVETVFDDATLTPRIVWVLILSAIAVILTSSTVALWYIRNRKNINYAM